MSWLPMIFAVTVLLQHRHILAQVYAQVLLCLFSDFILVWSHAQVVPPVRLPAAHASLLHAVSMPEALRVALRQLQADGFNLLQHFFLKK